MRLFVGGGGPIFDVGPVFGRVEGVDCGGGFREVEQADLSEDDVAAEGGDYGVVVWGCELYVLVDV